MRPGRRHEPASKVAALGADEVRQLVGQTQQSSREILTTLLRLQGDAEQAMAAISHGRQLAGLIVGQARETERVLQFIAAVVQTINDQHPQIATAVEEQATVTEDISRNLTVIQEVDHQTNSRRHRLQVVRRVTAIGTRLLVEAVSSAKTSLIFSAAFLSC